MASVHVAVDERVTGTADGSVRWLPVDDASNDRVCE
jgi:hypothetical protein